MAKKGDRLPELKHDVTATTIVLGALAARDWRPMHHDHDFAVNRNGMRDLFMSTPNQAAWFERFVTDWTGPKGRLGRMKFRMKGSVFAGDTMVLSGTVEDVTLDDTGCTWAELALAVSVDGTVVTECSARVALPADADDNPWKRRGDLVAAVMDLDLSPEQEMLRETVRGVCEQHAPLAVVRELEDDQVGYPEKLWGQLAGLDLCGLLLPDEHGGAGMSMLDAVIVYEELGRALAPVPHFVSTVISGGVLARAGLAEQKAEWLPRIAGGDAIVTPAWLEPEHGFGPAGVQLRAESDGDGYRLNGTKQHVAFAGAADRLLVLARTGDAPTDIGLFLVDPKADGVELTQQHAIASDTQYRVEFRGVTVPAADRIGETSGWNAWDATMVDGVILLAAQAIGGATHALDITVDYAKQRHQFEKPLGAFQAIAHYLADAVTTVDGGRTLVYEAGWAHTVGRPIDRLAPMAKLFACQTYRDVTAMAQQVFGGVGFTVDYDIQLYFRRAKQLQLSWWDPRYLEERVAATVLDRA